MSQLHERARQVFDAVVDRDKVERERALDAACGHDAALRRCVELLLTDYDGAQTSFRDAPARAGERAGDHIGPYRLLEVIGEGGFGTVWMAEQQQPIRRKVALKIVKWGMDTRQVVARFEAERQALALMEHPHIAKVFDGGATAQGRPYFAMELVRGVPITKYCDEARLTPQQRLELLVPVCEAVQHAHQKGVIHRDLKPSNVLVTLHDGKPVPKVIDFGIAKATAGQLTDKTVFTGFRQMLGTPEYMAPEQAEMSGLDVDTRADIYSLGVLLYELLTGTKPFELKEVLEAGWQELVRRIKEVDPDKPSTRVSTLGDRLAAIATSRRMLPKGLSHAFRGDLDWIVLKAMEKERGRRYETAHALAEDLQRHLRDEPVQASPPGQLYRWRKYLRRHRLGIAAGMAVATSLLLGALAAGWGYWTAKEQEAEAVAAARTATAERQAAVLARQQEEQQKMAALAAEAEARREAAKADSVVDLLTAMLASSDPRESKGRNYPVRMLLTDFARSLGKGLSAEPEVEAELRRVVGRSYLGLGMLAEAAPHLARSLELRRSLHGQRHAEVVQALLDAAELRHAMGQPADALALADQAADAAPVAGNSELHGLQARVQQRRGMELLEAGRYAEAEQAMRAALALALQQPGDGRASAAAGQNDLAVVLSARGNLDGAEELLQQALATVRTLQGEDHLNVANILCSLAEIRQSRGDLKGAERLLRRALDLRHQLQGEKHGDIAGNLDRLGSLLLRRKDLAGAEEQYRRAMAMRQEVLGKDHPALGASLNNLALVLQVRGDLAGAEDLLRQALERAQAQEGDAGPDVARVLANLARLRCARGDLASAEDLHRKALEMRRHYHGKEHLDVASSLHDLAIVLRQRRDLAAAEDLQQQALALQRRLWGQEHPEIAASLGNLGLIRWERGDAAGAEKLFRQSLEMRQKLQGEEHPDLGASLNNLALVLKARGDLAGADALFEQALRLARAGQGDAGPEVAIALANLGSLRFQRGDLASAEDLQQQALALRHRLFGDQHPDIASSLHELALVRWQRRDLGAAEDLQQQALTMQQDLLQAKDPAIAASLSNLGVIRRERGDYAGAVEPLQRSLALCGEVEGVQHTKYGSLAGLLGRTLAALDRHVEAEPLFRAAVACTRRLSDAPPQRLASELSLLGLSLLAQERFADSEPVLREDVECWRAAVGDSHPDYATSLDNLALAVARLGRSEEAIRLRQQSIEALRRAPGDQQLRLASCLARLAVYLLEVDRAADAEGPARECLSIRTSRQPETRPQHLATALLGRVLLALGRLEAAEPLLLDACTKLTTLGAKPWPREPIAALVALYRQQGKAGPAAEWEARLAAQPGAKAERAENAESAAGKKP